MTAIDVLPEIPTKDQIHSLCSQEGPCISIYASLTPQVNNARGALVRWKDCLDAAADLLVRRSVLETDRARLLAPLQALDKEALMRPGSGSLAVFRSPRLLEVLRLPWSVTPSVTVEGRFALLPLLERLREPQEFYILRLSKKETTLLHGTAVSFEDRPLPNGVPASFVEFLNMDTPDNKLDGRVASGRSGAKGSIRFSTSAPAEDQDRRFCDYLRAIGAGMRDMLREQRVPLVLAGIHDEASAYRRVNPDVWTAEETLPPESGERNELDLARRARALLADWVSPPERAACAEFERAGAGHIVAGAIDVVLAASSGRVGHLFLEQGEHFEGNLDRLTELVVPSGGFLSSRDDLFNAAARETLTHSGHVWVLPKDRMPTRESAAALVRY